MLRSVTFDLSADAEPGLLARVLVPFARRDITLDALKARRFGPTMQATLQCDAMSDDDVRLVEGNLRQIVGMHRVEVLLRGAVREVA